MLTTADATDPVLARYARAARMAAVGGCSCEPPGSPFGTNNYESIDDLPAGAENVEFVHGNIERIPLPAESVDAVISNCVLVLSPDKHAVFAEIVRVLRPGGRVGMSDIVRVGDDDGAEPLVDCGAAAITIDDYDAALRHAGLVAVTIEPTDRLGGGLSNAIVHATKPTASLGDQPAEGGGVPSRAPR